MAFTDSADMQDRAAQPDAGAAPGGGGGEATAPPGVGPILAALARRNMQPAVSNPGPGQMAQGLMMLKNAVDMMNAALPMLEPGSPPHKDALRALQTMSRHLPQGAGTAGVQQTQLGDMLRNTIRNSLLQRIMAQRGGGGGAQQPGAPGGGGGGAAAGGPPQMPTTATPSMPLPGA